MAIMEEMIRQHRFPKTVSDLKQPFPEETVTLDGEDITATVKEARDFLIAHSFAL